MKFVDINLLFERVVDEQQHIDEFNRRLSVLDEKKRKRCTIYPTDSANKIRRKCKRARVWGLHYAPVWDRYMTTAPSTSDTGETSDSTSTSGGDGGGEGGMEEIQGSRLVYPNSIGSDQDDEFINEQLKQLTYSPPNVEFEWEEAERYPEFKQRGMKFWEKTVEQGEIVPWSTLGDVNNHDPDLKNLDPNKIKRAALMVKKGVIELPIVGVWPDGEYELISGNTRTALLVRLGYDPEVLLVKIPDKKKRKPTKKKPQTKTKTTKLKKSSKPRKPTKKKEKPKSSTERVRRYYKRHPEKVRKYLRNTQDDRVKRNGDRAKAVKKYGKKKMKNHDVHHPNGVNGGTWRLAKKDHGRDKKNENVEYIYLSELMEGLAPNGNWQLISEGGAAGHLAHPYEDDSLKFKDVKEMIKRGLVGGLDAESPVTEKLDGQNIMFSVKDGQIIFARNKGQVKNRGKNALDVAGIRQMFAGRGNIEKAFSNAAGDLETAVASLSPEQQEQMFKNGSDFMNVEIIFPDTKNVIPYDKNVLVFHGTVSYDDEGNEIGRDINAGKTLSDALNVKNAQQQKTFGISGPRSIVFSDVDTAKNLEKMREYGQLVSRLQSEFKLKDTDTIEDYKRAWWEREINNMGVEWTSEEKEGLITRWATGVKKFGVKNIEDPEKKKFFREYEATSLANAQRIANRPLESMFLRLGADVLKRVTNFLSANNPEVAAELKKELLDTIKSIQQTDDQNKLAKLQVQMERLDAIGIDNLVPSEGVVFMYNGKPYKFTGTFAPINQILGTLKFKKGKAEDADVETEEEPTTPEPTPTEEPTEEPTKAPTQEVPTEEPEGEPRTVAIFTGRFQPFHAGHYSIYRAMVEKFGKENVYIATSNKTDAIQSPFSFKEKKEIMTQMFGIPTSVVVQVKNPYAPKEILDKLPPNTTYVTAVSQKDADRLTGGKYFRPYDETPPEERKGYGEQGYFIVAPEMQLQLNGKNISGTQIRSIMGDPKITDRAKQEIFTKIYGKFDKKIFDKIVKITKQSEEAKQLTDTHGGKEVRARATMKPKVVSTPPEVKAPEEPKSAPDYYQPGETWQTDGGAFGAKNRKGITRYYSSIESAQRFATT